MTEDSQADPPTALSRFWTTAGYGLMFAAAIGGFFLIRWYGESLTAPTLPAEVVPTKSHSPDSQSPNAAPGAKPARSDTLLRVLIALVAVIIAGQVLAKVFAYLSQPPVIGEVVAGILLGPSLIGESASAWVLPQSVAPYLALIAQLGVIVYMFLVGLELNAGLLKHRAHAVVATSHASILAPFLLGALLALWLYPRLATSDVKFTSFALFLGVAMSITAFPVLARILTDRRMSRTQLGTIALSCAAIDDVTAWCLLALVVGVFNAQLGSGLLVIAGTLAYIAFMFLVVRPVMARAVEWWEGKKHSEGGLSRGAVAIVFIALLLSALATEAIGIHAIFGAFLLGAVIPHDSAVAKTLTSRMEHVVTVLLLPAFFALTGMRTRIDLLSEASQWLICGLIVLVATLGKFFGTLAAARLTGMGWREGAILGTLMNTRGLMELIVLNVGLDLKIISPTLFAMMVLMALVTTMVTSPVLRLLKPPMEDDKVRG